MRLVTTRGGAGDMSELGGGRNPVRVFGISRVVATVHESGARFAFSDRATSYWYTGYIHM
jgi:hypothetical protein